LPTKLVIEAQDGRAGQVAVHLVGAIPGSELRQAFLQPPREPAADGGERVVQVELRRIVEHGIGAVAGARTERLHVRDQRDVLQVVHVEQMAKHAGHAHAVLVAVEKEDRMRFRVRHRIGGELEIAGEHPGHLPCIERQPDEDGSVVPLELHPLGIGREPFHASSVPGSNSRSLSPMITRG
jgi:hypothetical protein